MRWEDLDWEGGTWSIPRTKTGKARVVPLAQETVEILKLRKNDFQYLFPGPGKRGHLMEIRKLGERILKRAAIEDLRLHDLRRTVGSWMAAGGVNSPTIMQALGHSQPGTAQRYQRLNMDPVQGAIEQVAQQMQVAAQRTLTPPEGEGNGSDAQG